MDFDEAVDYLFGLGHETLAIKLGLRNTHLLLRALENPETAFPSVQIAGTNGKGSTAAFLDSILRSANIKTGLYTSPHLESITERIKISGVNVSCEDFAKHASQVRNAAHHLVRTGELDALPTFFEQVTAIALIAFREAGIQLAILETGLGGRLDSTTAANAKFCALTQIALDHEEYLGPTIASIAAEKAAIIRSGTKAVVAPQQPEALAAIIKRCHEVGVSPVVDCYKTTLNEVSSDGRFTVTFETANARYDKVCLGLRGRHQIENAAVAIQLTEILRSDGFRVSYSAIENGIEQAHHPGRLEMFGSGPQILLDGAHNPAGANALRKFLDEFAPHPLTIVFGCMRDKQIEEIVKILFPVADQLVLTPIENPRTAAPETLWAVAKAFERTRAIQATSSNEALNIALSKTNASGMICITGSLYLIGETRDRIIKQTKPVNIQTGKAQT